MAAWPRDYDLDGLRLGTADKFNQGFTRDLAAYCRCLNPDLWLMGEVLRGDYRSWMTRAGRTP